MISPVQPTNVFPTASQPATTTSKTSTEWQQFYDWFAYGILPGSGAARASHPEAIPPAAHL